VLALQSTHEPNPISRYLIRHYEHRTSPFVRRLDTVGIIVVALALCMFMFMSWLSQREAFSLSPSGYFDGRQFNRVAQYPTWAIYIAMLVRCAIASVNVTSHLHRDQGKMIVLTGVSMRRLLNGSWSAALYQVRGWVVALGLVRVAAVILMVVEAQFGLYWGLVSDAVQYGFNFTHYSNIQRTYTPGQVPLTLAIIITLVLIEVWTMIGIGMAVSVWLKHPTLSWVFALFLRLLPIVTFVYFPAETRFGISTIDMPESRYGFTTWFALADGAMTSVLRFSMPWIFDSQMDGAHLLWRAWLGLFAVLFMLLGYALLAYIATRLWMKRVGASVGSYPEQETLKAFGKTKYLHENKLALLFTICVCIAGYIRWTINSTIDLSAPGSYGDYSFWLLPRFWPWLVLAFCLIMLRGIIAGTFWGDKIAKTQPHTSTTIIGGFNATLFIFRRLQVWWYGLSFAVIVVMLMVAWGHFIVEFSTQQQLCGYSQNIISCSWTRGAYPIIAWAMGLMMAILLPGLTLLSSIALGLGMGKLLRSRWAATLIAFAFRTLPFISGLPSVDPPYNVRINCPPDFYFRTHPLMMFIDSGSSILLSLANPFHEPGLYRSFVVSQSLLSFGAIVAILAVVTFLGLLLACLPSKLSNLRHNLKNALRSRSSPSIA